MENSALVDKMDELLRLRAENKELKAQLSKLREQLPIESPPLGEENMEGIRDISFLVTFS